MLYKGSNVLYPLEEQDAVPVEREQDAILVNGVQDTAALQPVTRKIEQNKT